MRSSQPIQKFQKTLNLCCYQIGHCIQVQWPFFATSHRNLPCDGIGGITKRLVPRASLQATKNWQILTPSHMCQWANQIIGGIIFFYMADQEASNNVKLIYFIYLFYLYIYPPDSQERDRGAIHSVGNYPDLLPKIPRYCCPLVI